jgi:hypothetical protein
MTEIEKLESLIREKHPNWNIEVSDLCDGRKIALLDGKGSYVCDVVCHSYSYGGKEGLLEWWNCKKKTDPIGWLTAERALVVFEESLKADGEPLEGKG